MRATPIRALSGQVPYSDRALSLPLLGPRSFSAGPLTISIPASGTDMFQRITLPKGAGFFMSLQWDSPAASVSPGASGSPNDLDVYVFNAAGTQVLAGSVLDNINGDPIEVFSFVNTTGVTADFNIMITNFAGANPGLMKYVMFGFGGTIQEFATNSGTIYGHTNAAGAEAVGAAAYFQTPAFGVSPPLLEFYSSSGTTPILFDLAGNRLPTPDPRADKPEITAPDCVNTTFFFAGEDSSRTDSRTSAAHLLQRPMRQRRPHCFSGQTGSKSSQAISEPRKYRDRYGYSRVSITTLDLVSFRRTRHYWLR